MFGLEMQAADLIRLARARLAPIVQREAQPEEGGRPS
jgi:hypothetical protein